MKLRADFARRELVRLADLPWTDSPVGGVARRPLDRIGQEVARATSLVRYAPGGRFPYHVHGGGEEFLVLEGSFHDAAGDYPAGTYVRNPPDTDHTPWAGPDGAVLFVKLRQFDPHDRRRVVIDTRALTFARGLEPGHLVQPLHAHGTERVSLEHWDPGEALPGRAPLRGFELLVIEGSLEAEEGSFPAPSWLRVPEAARVAARAGPEGMTALVKTGHLGPLLWPVDGVATP